MSIKRINNFSWEYDLNGENPPVTFSVEVLRSGIKVNTDLIPWEQIERAKSVVGVETDTLLAEVTARAENAIIERELIGRRANEAEARLGALERTAQAWREQADRLLMENIQLREILLNEMAAKAAAMDDKPKQKGK